MGFSGCAYRHTILNWTELNRKRINVVSERQIKLTRKFLFQNLDWNENACKFGSQAGGDGKNFAKSIIIMTPSWGNGWHLPCDSLTPEPMKDAAVSAAPGPVVEPSPSPRSWTYFQETERLRNVDSPLKLSQLVWQKTNYKIFRHKGLN